MQDPHDATQPRPDRPERSLSPEAAAPLDGGPIQLGGLRAVGAGARVQIPVVATASRLSPDDAPAPAQEPGVDEGGLDPASVYVQAGGEPTFRHLVHVFYREVAGDPILRPMYPEEDLGPAEERQRLFLIQYFGGPTSYSERRGHPRLRMRHFPFAVDSAARAAWLRCMRTAMDETELSPLIDGIMWDYFERAATAMINTPG